MFNLTLTNEQFLSLGQNLSAQNEALQRRLRQMQWGLRMGSIMPQEVFRALGDLRSNMDLIAIFLTEASRRSPLIQQET